MTVFVLAFILALLGSANAATISVPSGSNLQSFISAANCGDTLVLEAGATYMGTFVLVAPKGTCTDGDSDYVTVTTSGSLPAEGVRIDPSQYSGEMAKLVSPNTMPPLSTETGAHHWKFIGIDISNTEGAFVPSLITLGQSSVTGDVPGWTERLAMKGFVFDRCFVHPPEISSTHLSDPATTRYAERGFLAQASDMFIINSYVAGFAGFDPQGTILASEAVLMDGGPGPLTVMNTYLEAWYSNVFLGGADAAPDPAHQATVSAAGTIGTATLSHVSGLSVDDLVAFKVGSAWEVGKVTGISGNTITYTPQSAGLQPFSSPPDEPGLAQWKGFNLSGVKLFANSFVKRPEWSVGFGDAKNWLEVKAGRNIEIEGNTMASGTPTNIALTVRNQSGSSPWIAIDNLTLRSNELRDVGDHAFSIQLNDNERVTGNDSGNVLVANNLILSGAPDFRLAFTNGGHDVVFRHNTFFIPWAILDGSSPLTGLSMVDNIVNNGQYGLSCFYGDNERSTCWPGYNISTNVIIDNQSVGGLASSYPGNFIAENQAAVQFVDAAGGNFRLADTSPYKGMASDGIDPGIDQDALDAALAGKRTPGASDAPTPGPSDTATPVASVAATPDASDTPTASPSDTPTASPSATPTASPSATPTATPSATPTAAPSDTPTESASATPTPSATPTLGPAATPTPGASTLRHPKHRRKRGSKT